VIALGIAMAAGAIWLLHVSWQRAIRSVALNVLAWALLFAALIVGARDAGAWGMTLVSIGAIGAALALLGWAAWMSPPGKSKASSRRVNMLPEPGEPRMIGRRVLTFVLTVPLAFIVVILVSVAARGVAVSAGWNEADANVLTLLLLPLLWAVLIAVMLLETRRVRQYAMLALPALVSGGVLIAGVGQ